MTGERFRCPKCGGSSFGSICDAADPLNKPMHRYCHGNDAGDGQAGCKFDWPDTDDWKYFLVNGARLSQADYKAFRDRLRGMSIEGRPYP